MPSSRRRISRPSRRSSRPSRRRSSYRDEKRSHGRHNTRRGSTRHRDYSSGSDFTGSSSFTGSYSGSDSESYTEDSISGSDSLRSGDSDSDTLSGSSYTTPSSFPSSDSGESTIISDESRAENDPNPKSVKRNPNASRLAMAAALALQRRKKESPKLRASIEQRKVREVDYDVNPTKLYHYIEKTMWREAAERCRTSPIDAKTWVFRSRKQGGGGLMWRMLPIHTAVLYRAPAYVLLDLLNANPNGPSEPDDRNMLPIHMACRIICKEDVLRLLLKHNPSSLKATDIKGRTPMKFLKDQKKDKTQSRTLQKVNAKNRKQLIHVLEECEWQIKEGTFQFVEDTSDTRIKSSASVSSRMSGRPQVRMRQKNFGNVDQSNRPASSKQKDSPISIHASMSMDRPSRRDRGDNQGILSRSRSNSVNGRAHNGHGSRAIAKARDSPPKLPPRSNRFRNDEPNENFQRSTNTEPKGGRPRSSSVSSNRRDKNSKMGKYHSHGRDEDESETRDDRSQKSPPYQEFNDSIEELSGPSGTDNSFEVSKNGIGEKEKVLEPEENIDVNDGMYGDDDSSGNPSEEYQEFESLATFWTEIEGQHDLVDEVPTHDTQQVIGGEKTQNHESKPTNSRRKPKPLKFYEPPTELKKLLKIIQSPPGESGATDAQGKYGIPINNTNGNARRVNACGALKALAKKETNRLRLARTKGVVSSVCYMIIDPTSSKEERIRCSATLVSLCVPSQNWEAVTAIYGDILDDFRNVLESYDGRILYNICFSLFLLTKSEKNRHVVCMNMPLVDAMSNVLTSPIHEDTVATNNESLQVNTGLGSPSDIVTPGSLTTNDESQRGSRMCMLKTFLNIVKIQKNAHEIARDTNLITSMTNLLGTMPPKENLLCMAIFTNLTRHKDNCEYLMREHPDFFSAVLKIAASADTESKKCANLALQNLSCDKICRKNFIKYPDGLPIISKLASKCESNHDSRMSALHTMKNLCNEPSYMASLLESNVALNTLCATAKDKKKPEFQIIASDGLATMAQWLYSSAETCIAKNDIDIGNRPLGSMSCTWDQWH